METFLQVETKQFSQQSNKKMDRVCEIMNHMGRGDN